MRRPELQRGPRVPVGSTKLGPCLYTEVPSFGALSYYDYTILVPQSGCSVLCMLACMYIFRLMALCSCVSMNVCECP